MNRLENVTLEELQETLNRVNEKKAAIRVVAAIAYKNGITQSELASWFDVERKTIYNWLTRFETEDFDASIKDQERPGRPRKLTKAELESLKSILHQPPTEAGHASQTWNVSLVQELLEEEFDSEYSRPSCRRLMKELGLRYRRPKRTEVDSLGEQIDPLGHVWLPG